MAGDVDVKETVHMPLGLKPVVSMDENWPEVMTSKVQKMCDILQRRYFEIAVIILDKGSGKILTYGSSVGTAFFLSRPDIATLFQDFYKMHSNGRDTIVTEQHNISEELEYTDFEDSSSSKSENEEEGENDRESSDQNSFISNEKNEEEIFEKSTKVTRQTKEVNTPKGKKKGKTFNNMEKKTCIQDLNVPSETVTGLAEQNSLEKFEPSENMKDQPVFECSECKKQFKNQAGLTTHRTYVHLKGITGIELTVRENLPRNLQLQYIDRDGKEVSGVRSSMYEKHVADEMTKFSCKICSYSTDRYNVMIEHTQTHVIRDLLECNLCHKVFQAKKSLWRHKNQHKKFPHMCTVCLRMYESEEDLKEHENSHKTSHVCTICKRTYDSIGRLNYHIKTSHGPKQNKCEVCGSSFTNKSLLRQHERRHGPKRYFCDKCSCSYYFMHQLTNHLKIHDENSFKFKCSVCSKEYINKSHWKEHMKLHDGLNFVQCDECGKSYNSRKSLNLHRNTKHVDERKFICQICGKAFMTKHHLKNHLITHDDKRDYKCRFCDATFKKNDVLKMHENVHTREQKFICDICGENFLRRSSLRNHRLTHFPGHQRWKCRYCEDRFRTQSAMLTHVKNKHSDLDLSHERPLCKRCEQCGKVFAKGLTFRVHMDMHAGIKRHTCQVCGSAFTDPANLRVHQKIHNGSSKKYSCGICDVRFVSVKQYTSHMQKHSTKGRNGNQQFNGNIGLNLTVMQTKSAEEGNKASDTDHVNSATVPEIETPHLKQDDTNQRLSNFSEASRTESCLNDSANIQTMYACPQIISSNIGMESSSHGMESSSHGMESSSHGMESSSHGMDSTGYSGSHLGPNVTSCHNISDQSVSGSLRQAMDVKSYDHIQLYYTPMF